MVAQTCGTNKETGGVKKKKNYHGLFGLDGIRLDGIKDKCISQFFVNK